MKGIQGVLQGSSARQGSSCRRFAQKAFNPLDPKTFSFTYCGLKENAGVDPYKNIPIYSPCVPLYWYLYSLPHSPVSTSKFRSMIHLHQAGLESEVVLQLVIAYIMVPIQLKFQKAPTFSLQAIRNFHDCYHDTAIKTSSTFFCCY